MTSLTVVVRTPHGVSVSGARVHLTHAAHTLALTTDAEGARAELPSAGTWNLRVEPCAALWGVELLGLASDLTLTPAGALFVRDQGPTEAVAWIELARTHEGCTLTATLDYRWFTPLASAPSTGNKVDVLIDGEDAWAAVADAIESAAHTVHLTTWIYQGTLELRRPDPYAEPEERERHTIQATLDRTAQRGVDVRLLLWDAPLVGMSAELEEAAQTSDDHFEVLKEANPTSRPLLPNSMFSAYNDVVGGLAIGSFHQKTAVIDSVTGFCGGMNLKENDWDTPRHDWFDPRRCAFSRDRLFRMDVERAEETPDHIPRHDVMARVVGPAVADLEANFRQRWNHLIRAEAAYSAQATVLPEPATVKSVVGQRGGAAVQVVRTMPSPVDERSVLDVYLRAIRAAERMIYIEDQYFRSTYVADALVEALARKPALELVVLTKSSEANGLLTGAWSYECVQRIRRVRRDFTLFGLYVPRVDEDGDHHVEEVDNHAKVMIVDDWFFTIGSCNLNDRGFEFEGEINVAVVDPPTARAMRTSLFREHLEGDARVTGEIDVDLAVWREHATRNAEYRGGAVRPYSRVFPFETQWRPRLFDRDVF